MTDLASASFVFVPPTTKFPFRLGDIVVPVVVVPLALARDPSFSFAEDPPFSVLDNVAEVAVPDLSCPTAKGGGGPAPTPARASASSLR